MTTRKADAALPWTEDKAATELLARNPMALLIGFLLDRLIAFVGRLVSHGASAQ